MLDTIINRFCKECRIIRLHAVTADLDKLTGFYLDYLFECECGHLSLSVETGFDTVPFRK